MWLNHAHNMSTRGRSSQNGAEFKHNNQPYHVRRTTRATATTSWDFLIGFYHERDVYSDWNACSCYVQGDRGLDLIHRQRKTETTPRVARHVTGTRILSSLTRRGSGPSAIRRTTKTTSMKRMPRPSVNHCELQLTTASMGRTRMREDAKLAWFGDYLVEQERVSDRRAR